MGHARIKCFVVLLQVTADGNVLMGGCVVKEKNALCCCGGSHRKAQQPLTFNPYKTPPHHETHIVWIIGTSCPHLLYYVDHLVMTPYVFGMGVVKMRENGCALHFPLTPTLPNVIIAAPGLVE